MNKGEQIEINENKFSFYSVNNKMSVKLPETDKAYILEYEVYVTRENVTLNNNVKLVGSAISGSGTGQ